MSIIQPSALYIQPPLQTCGVGISSPIWRTPRVTEVKKLRPDQSPPEQQSHESEADAVFLLSGRSFLTIALSYLDPQTFQYPGSLSFGPRPSVFPLLDPETWAFDQYVLLLLSDNVLQIDSWNS